MREASDTVRRNERLSIVLFSARKYKPKPKHFISFFAFRLPRTTRNEKMEETVCCGQAWPRLGLAKTYKMIQEIYLRNTEMEFQIENDLVAVCFFCSSCFNHMPFSCSTFYLILSFRLFCFYDNDDMDAEMREPECNMHECLRRRLFADGELDVRVLRWNMQRCISDSGSLHHPPQTGCSVGMSTCNRPDKT